MPLVDSAGGGAGWAEGQLGVADFAAEVQNASGRGGVEGGGQGDGRGPRFFLAASTSTASSATPSGGAPTAPP